MKSPHCSVSALQRCGGLWLSAVHDNEYPPPPSQTLLLCIIATRFTTFSAEGGVQQQRCHLRKSPAHIARWRRSGLQPPGRVLERVRNVRPCLRVHCAGITSKYRAGCNHASERESLVFMAPKNCDPLWGCQKRSGDRPTGIQRTQAEDSSQPACCARVSTHRQLLCTTLVLSFVSGEASRPATCRG